MNEHVLDALVVRSMSTREIAEWLSSYPESYGYWTTEDADTALNELATEGRVRTAGEQSNSLGTYTIWEAA